ncbi:alpha/beta hydrolase [Azotosporobacter soli]|uniref:alpha/beta hydrolase n=1 Tax=Azotosporobacter soli TaxID=3055040 RepID=UPI0031FEE1D2
MNDAESFCFTTKENIRLTFELHRAKSKRKNITVLYFHGGGLLYGTRDDLPTPYLQQFLAAGYDFLALDYPLAPEAPLPLILRSAFEALSFYFANRQDGFNLQNERYILFGRSAGAYLSLMLCALLLKNKTTPPLAVISLYGYARLDEPQFAAPSKFYNKLPPVPDETIAKIVLGAPQTYGPIALRFSLYIKARQDGTWLKQLCGDENPANYSLDEATLAVFPPTFLAAATLDPDVPYRMSKTLSKQIPNARLLTLYREAHDFDRDTSDESGRFVYEEILSWLDDKANAGNETP